MEQRLRGQFIFSLYSGVGGICVEFEQIIVNFRISKVNIHNSKRLVFRRMLDRVCSNEWSNHSAEVVWFPPLLLLCGVV